VLALLTAAAALFVGTALAQGVATPPPADAPAWGASRAGLGYPAFSDALFERADEEGIDPRCLMTITIAWTQHPGIVANVANGLMEVLVSGVTRAEAQAVLVEESPYFDSDIDCTGASQGAAAAAHPAWTGGVYGSTYGDIDFGSGGAQGRGMYDDGEAFVAYVLEGRTMTGAWIEPSSASQCETTRGGSEYWGWIEFEFNEDFSEWPGLWGYCDYEVTRGTWTGTREE
jgi:hypothetical protein